MILWRNIENYPFLSFPTPDFPHFFYMLGGNLGSLLYGDVSVMHVCIMLDLGFPVLHVEFQDHQIYGSQGEMF